MDDPGDAEEYRGRIDCIDFFYPLLQEVAELIDSKLDQIDDEAADLTDPDAFGLTDRAEYVIGFGFVACQEYLTSITGTEKRDARLRCGPARGRFTLAETVNAAANYWKHHGEWSTPPKGVALTTIDILRELGVDAQGYYPMLETIARLRGDLPKRFGALLPGLAAWRDEVFAKRSRGE